MIFKLASYYLLNYIALNSEIPMSFIFNWVVNSLKTEAGHKLRITVTVLNTVLNKGFPME